ncbi:hypothetical protein ABID21_004892 [Pseudorhizobium tarimense]|uniref:Uncharacterized protein n=1 Tax=Pseudorhizobium tarimense TaxID=1079109 RepID=A0ABV2HDY0_9HYPH
MPFVPKGRCAPIHTAEIEVKEWPSALDIDPELWHPL